MWEAKRKGQENGSWFLARNWPLLQEDRDHSKERGSLSPEYQWLNDRTTPRTKLLEGAADIQYGIPLSWAPCSAFWQCQPIHVLSDAPCSHQGKAEGWICNKK